MLSRSADRPDHSPILTVLVNLPGYKLPGAVTADFMRGVLFGNSATSATSNPDWSVDGFWQEASDGRAWVAPGSTVIGPIALTSNFNTNTSGASSCDTYGMRDAVIAAIDGQVDFRNYSRILIVTPGNGACSWAGTANVGCRVMSSNGDGEFNASVAWQRAESMATRTAAVQLTTHELGHNLTLSHAGSRDFGTEALGAIGATGTLSEYGDPFSTMGSWNFGFYAASQAANQLQWLGAGSNYTVVETSGTYTIQGYETRPAGVKALKVRRGTGNNSWLWLESRQNVGNYSSRLDSSAFRGALVHFEDATTGNDSHLLDFTTATTSFTDAPMPAGSSWTDPYSNLNVTVNSVSSAGMTVTVNYGSATCTDAAPTVTLSPVAASAEQGGTVRLALTVKNNSTQACAAESFAITAAAPGGWTARPATAALNAEPRPAVADDDQRRGADGLCARHLRGVGDREWFDERAHEDGKRQRHGDRAASACVHGSGAIAHAVSHATRGRVRILDTRRHRAAQQQLGHLCIGIVRAFGDRACLVVVRDCARQHQRRVGNGGADGTDARRARQPGAGSPDGPDQRA